MAIPTALIGIFKAVGEEQSHDNKRAFDYAFYDL